CGSARVAACDQAVARTDVYAVLGLEALREISGLLREAVFRRWLGEEASECGLDLADLDAVLRALGAGNGGRDAGEIELDDPGVVDLTRLRDSEQPLSFEVRLQR